MIIKNGNYEYRLEMDGTKERFRPDGDEYRPIFPESIDLKITDYCDAGCSFCYAESTKKGRHASLQDLMNAVYMIRPYSLRPPIELAIGGGNPLSHPDFWSFISLTNRTGFISNATVNQKHWRPELLQSKVNAWGYSYVDKLPDLPDFYNNDRIVVHVIAGVHDISVLEKLAGWKVLVLGYKSIGRGLKFMDPTVKKRLARWRRHLHRYAKFPKILAFDNLGLEQLEPLRLVDNPDRYYMGNDGTFSMYVDAVNRKFYKNSLLSKAEGQNFSEYPKNEFWRLNE